MGVEMLGMEKISISIDDEVNQSIEKYANMLVTMIKNRAPRKSGDYADGWTWEMRGNMGVVFNNGPHKTLAHLLEYGHWNAERKRYNPPIPHILPSYEYVKELFYEDLKKINFNK